MVRYRTKVPIREKRLILSSKAKRLKKERETQREETRKKKVNEVMKYLVQGEDAFKNHQLKKAYYLFTNARIIVSYYDKELEEKSKGSVEEVLAVVRDHLRSELEAKLENVIKLFRSGEFGKIKSLILGIKRQLERHKWAKISGVIGDFEKLVLLQWKEIFPVMLKRADSLYDRQQYPEAKALFSKCKSIVREFNFGPDRTHLIKAFMKYEAICDAQINVAEMFHLLERTELLIIVRDFNGASVLLSRADKIQFDIPLQFRDRKKLTMFHLRMNNLRKKLSVRAVI